MEIIRVVRSLPLLIVFAGALAAPGCKDDSDTADAEEVEPKKKEKKKRRALFGDVRIGKRVIPSFPIDDDKPKRWHYRVHFLGKDVTKFEWVGPSGTVFSRTEIDKTDDGLNVAYFDAYGVATEHQELRDGVVTSKQRSGATTINGCDSIKEEYDDEGRVVQIRCIDRWGLPRANSDGCHVEARTYGEDHALLTKRCLDAQGQAKNDRDDVHERAFTYGKQGEQLTLSFTKSSGEHPAGCAVIRYHYDDALNIVREECLNGSRQPIAFLGSKAFRTLKIYDDNGCLTKVSYVDADGQAATRSHIAEWRYGRNTLCDITLEESRDLVGKLKTPNKGEPARTQFTRNAEGRQTERRCFGADEKPTSCRRYRGEATVIRYEYDSQGRLVAWSGFDMAGEPKRQDADYPHQFRQTFDDKGRVTRLEFFDGKGTAAVALGGVHATVTDYDDAGLKRSISTHGVDGKLVLPTTHCPTITFERDAKHQLVKMQCLGTDGKPRRSRLIYRGIDWKGAASLEIVRDKGELKNVLRDVSGKVVKTISCRSEGAACME